MSKSYKAKLAEQAPGDDYATTPAKQTYRLEFVHPDIEESLDYFDYEAYSREEATAHLVGYLEAEGLTQKGYEVFNVRPTHPLIRQYLYHCQSLSVARQSDGEPEDIFVWAPDRESARTRLHVALAQDEAPFDLNGFKIYPVYDNDGERIERKI